MDKKAEEKTSKSKIYRKLESCGVLRPFFLTLSALFILALIVYTVSRFSTGFAEFWARHMSVGIRFITATLTSVFPFSVAEILMLLVPLVLVIIIWVSIKMIVKNKGHGLSKLLLTLVSVLMVISIIFGLGFGPCYFRNNLADNLGLNDEPVSAESLYDTAVWLTESINEVLPHVSFSADGESHMPYSFSELTSVVNDAFNDYAADEDFISSFNCPIKIIALSDIMTYTHISGIYAFFTGESNVNVNYP
ncbi:DUF3810 family protein, partial [Candidatus Nomurabacteria bacterium]|nr:DUF3810 family protein [Candidatus Nomurabacteria bacterium]